MGSRLAGDGPEQLPSSATYWRRRFVILVVGLAVIAVVAWAVSGALRVSKPPAGHSGASGHHSGASGPGGAVRLTGNGTSSPSADPRSSASPSASPSPSASASPQARHHKAATRITSGKQHGTPPLCKSADVVLSLSATQVRYGPGQLPEFAVDVVSTSAQTCRYNIGPRYLALVITNGAARIASSADCVKGSGSLLASLVRGVPTVVPMSWDRQTSVPGCDGGSHPARSGSYSASASDGSLVSNARAFRLTG